MKRFAATLAMIGLAACSPMSNNSKSGSNAPPDITAAATVQAIYANAQSHMGSPEQTVIPMTDDLKSLVDRAEAAAHARDEPFIDGDLALNCQDCATVTDLVIGAQSGAQQEPARAGHAWVQATFKINGQDDRRVLWDMAQTPSGWRADNVVSEGFDLRSEAQAYLANPAAPASGEAP